MPIVAISQYGYNPEHRKTVSYVGSAATFDIYNATTNTPVSGWTAKPLVAKTDGLAATPVTVSQGDFSAFVAEGSYYVKVGADKSLPFAIKAHLWDDLVPAIAHHYFTQRRQGEDNVGGNFGDFRLVEWNGVKTVRAEHRDISHGFGDGGDGRIYASQGLVAAEFCNMWEKNRAWDKGDWIYEQIKWAVQGCCEFLEKNGNLLNILLADDHQVWTYDRQLGGKKIKTMTDGGFDKGNTGSEYNKLNEEVIQSSLLIGPAYGAALFKSRDPDFWGPIADLVRAGYNTTYARFYAGSPAPKYSLAAWAWLNVCMFKLDGLEMYKARAIDAVNKLLTLQQTAAVEGVRGWFRRATDSTISPYGEKPEQEIMIVPWIYQGIIKAIETFPADAGVPAWKEALRSYCEDYLLKIAGFNAFGYTPMKAEASATSKLARKKGGLAYQYFGAIGRQFHQMGNAAFLLQVGTMLGKQNLVDAAWQQMYWFAGHNPIGKGFINGFSTNNDVCGFCYETLGREFDAALSNGTCAETASTETMIPGGYTKVVTNDSPNYTRYNEYYTYGNLDVLWFASGILNPTPSPAVYLWPAETRETPRNGVAGKNVFPIRLKGGHTYNFGALVKGDAANAVAWTATAGTVVGGRYTAPAVSAETVVTITATSIANPVNKAETKVTILPVPVAVAGLTAVVGPVTNANGTTQKVTLRWTPVSGNVQGYAVFKRLPTVKDAAGNVQTAGGIWEQVGSVYGATASSYQYPNFDANHPNYKDSTKRVAYLSQVGVIKNYLDDTMAFPSGTEFMVRAFNHKPIDASIYPADTGNLQQAGWLMVWKTDPNRSYGFGPGSNVVKIDGVVPPPPVTWSTVDSNSGSIVKTGAWTTQADPAALGGSRIYANAVGASVALTAVTTGFKVIAANNTNRGYVDIKIDGVVVKTVDTYSAAANQVEIFAMTGLTAGVSHTITVTITGQKNPASAGTFFSLDAFQIVV